MVNWYRVLIGIPFLGAGIYILYYAVHPVNNLTLGISVALFTMAGLIMDFDDVGKALLKIGETKITIPK